MMNQLSRILFALIAFICLIIFCAVQAEALQVAPPASITVPANDLDGSYVVKWGASATGGVTYQLQEATDSAFTVNVRTAYSGKNLSVLINGRASGKTYFYRIRAKKTGYTSSAWRDGANGCAVGVYQAYGTYTFNPTITQLKLNIEMTNFPDCWGPSKAETMLVMVTTLTPTVMTWVEAGDDDTITWTGANGGGIVGIWTMANEGINVTLVFYPNGTWNFSADKSDIDNYNDCASYVVPYKTIVIDGDYSDWSSISSVNISDKQSNCGNAPGLDITAIYIAQDNNYIYLRYVLNGKMNLTYGYKFGENLHIYIGDSGNENGYIFWGTPILGLGSNGFGSSYIHIDYDVELNSYQFEAKFNKCDIQGWWDNRQLAAWCDQGFSTACREHIGLPRLIFDFSSCPER